MKKVYNKVYGCKVNQYETQAVSEQLERRGYAITKNVKDADYVIVNTCTVTKQSDRELEYFIRKVRRDNAAAKIFLLGCYVDHYADRVKDIEGVCGVFNNEHKFAIAEYLKKFEHENEFTEWHKDQHLVDQDRTGISHFKGHTRAFIKVQDGCNRVCSYCIVRVVRGKSRSRLREDIIEEIQRCADAQYQEVVLTGVQLGAYGKDLCEPLSVAQLVEDISKIEAIKRIRLSSIEPMDIDDDLIACLRENKKACAHLHISLQSGDNGVLKEMRRGYGKDDFIRLIRRLEHEIPGFVYSTDVIVGFPGESDKAFENTVQLIHEIPPMKIHVFPFSEREGTLAAEFPDKVPQKTKKERVQALLSISNKCFRTVAERLIGTIQPLLVEETRLCDNGYEVSGKLATYLPVKSYFNASPSDPIVSVRITGLNGVALIAEPVL